MIEKYQLKFYIDDRGYSNAISDKYSILGSVLVEFIDDINKILDSSYILMELIRKIPKEKMHKGKVPDEEFYQYWRKVEENEYYHSNIYIIRIDGSYAELEYEFEEYGMKIPIIEFIDILKMWQRFLTDKEKGFQ
jgi:hypothetical protein